MIALDSDRFARSLLDSRLISAERREKLRDNGIWYLYTSKPPVIFLKFITALKKTALAAAVRKLILLRLVTTGLHYVNTIAVEIQMWLAGRYKDYTNNTTDSIAQTQNVEKKCLVNIYEPLFHLGSNTSATDSKTTFGRNRSLRSTYPSCSSPPNASELFRTEQLSPRSVVHSTAPVDVP